MGLTLGMSTAVSGLLTNQKGLDVISQNIVNVNTKGYVRKVMTPESVAVGGIGAGVQTGEITRSIDEGLMTSIRAQTSTQGKLTSDQQYYPMISDLFGQVGDANSIAHQIQSLQSAFQGLSAGVTTPALQSQVVQSALDTTNQLNQMTTQLQGYRLQADRAVQDTVTLVNQKIGDINSLNQQIVRGLAVGAQVGDLQDKRDTSLTDLSGYMDIQYFPRGDGSVGVYTQSGKVLVDNTASTMNHAATTITDSWMTAAGGNFNPISLSGTTASTDISADIGAGQLRSLLDMRDKVIPNLQSQLDELSSTMKDQMNLVHNAGTCFPTTRSQITGTRQFMDVNNPTINEVQIAANGAVGTSVTADGSATADSTHLLTSLTNASTGASLGITVGQTFTLTNSSTTATFTVTAASTMSNLQTFIKGTNLGPVGFNTAVDTSGHLAITTVGGASPANDVTISGSGGNALATALGLSTALPAAGGAAGTTIGTTALASTLIPSGLVPAPQKIWLSGNDDTTIALFDSSGNQVASTTLRTIMSSTSFNDASGAPTALDISSAPGTPGVTLTDMAAKIQNWMKAQSYQGNALNNASASFVSGKLALDTGNSTLSLGFRDQTATANGSTATNARINFDVNGDGKADQTVAGFSNFFGLNDLFTKSVPNSINDSNVQNLSFRTTSTRTIQLSDPTGQIGNAIAIPSGSSMADIATAINNQTQTVDSAVLASPSFTTTSSTNIAITDSNGTVANIAIPAGNLTLTSIATALDAVGGSVQAKAVQDGPNAYQLRIWDSRGVPLTVSITGGAIGSTNIGNQLGLQNTSLVHATVIPDGSGYRLRIAQTGDKELYVGATPDSLTPPGSLITDLGLHASATRSAGNLSVRTDIQGSPALLSRGSMQYNADLGQYYLSEGDNTSALALSKAMNTKNTMRSAGDVYAGTYSLAEYASATISVVSTNASHSKDQLTYQTTLGQALNSQYSSFSGVNLDEEVSNMINFQQAYSASAKVISTLQEMLDTLVNIIH